MQRVLAYLQLLFQHTAARRRLGVWNFLYELSDTVSTHSRPKAAGSHKQHRRQPTRLFQHTAARRRLDSENAFGEGEFGVSTHSRPKAAGAAWCSFNRRTGSFNTQPPEGGWVEKYKGIPPYKVSTHSRPKAAGPWIGVWPRCCCKCFNTQPPEGGW